MTEYPHRKPNRLKGFDYSTPRAYFVTFCTQDRRCILSTIVGASMARPPCLTLTEHGRTIDAAIQSIPHHYPLVQVDKYVIMPNHIHVIIRLLAEERIGKRPDVISIVRAFKSLATRMCNEVHCTPGKKWFQSSFYDEILRNEKAYQECWRYIDENPLKWLLKPEELG